MEEISRGRGSAYDAHMAAAPRIVDSPPPEGMYKKVSVAELLLDPENPRLAAMLNVGNVPTQRELTRELWTEMAVAEVALSIAANGYLAGEPLLVIEQRGDGSGPPYVVLEGNRRLAAVKILLDSKLKTELRATNLPAPTAQILKSLAELPVVVYPSRESIWSYLGFRHINGSKPWDAFAKAEYVEMVHETYGITLPDIARKIGDQHATVRRLYRGLKILRQAETDANFDRDDIYRNRFYFSHLYTAVDQAEFQKFLGITSDGSLKSSPVPKARTENLKDLMIWVYGRRSSNTEPVVRTQFPDLNQLRDVVASPRSVSALRSGLSLQTAHDISIGDERRLRDSLARAEEELRRARGSVLQGFGGESDLLELIQSVVLLATNIQREMEDAVAASGKPRIAAKR